MSNDPKIIHHFTKTCLTVIGTAILLSSSPFGRGQITFNAFDNLHVPGESLREYIITNANPSGRFGSTGGPQNWNFSQLGRNYVRTVDIVSPTNGNHQASFPGASYAEYFSDGISMFDGELDYYSIDTNAGQLYYGSYNPQAGISAWSPPLTNMPAVLGFGSNWTSSTSSDSIAPYDFIDTITCTVDAYGTVVLPEIGSFQALRVNQLTEEQEEVFGVIAATFYIREYFWLVPGIGEAVDIVSTYASAPPPDNFTSAAEIRVVFPQVVTNLAIQLEGNSVNLTWPAATTPLGYQVQMTGDLATTNWQKLASPASNSWSEPLTTTNRFYRVFIEP